MFISRFYSFLIGDIHTGTMCQQNIPGKFQNSVIS